jgi:hypothetical protein
MPFRRLTLLVVVYVALDLANPMMPGAVQLVGGALETIDGCQHRIDDAGLAALPATSCDTVRVTPRQTLSASTTVRVSPRFSLGNAVSHAPLEPISTDAPSSSDDG